MKGMAPDWKGFYDDEASKEMYSFARELWPICRSLTGEGVRQTLDLINERLRGTLEIHNVPSGTKCFDWEVPDEWNIWDAYVLDPRGKKIIDFKSNNLHVVGYSEPIDREMTLEELKPHLFSLPKQPDAIPYLTSYYRRSWGFCLTHNQLKRLKRGRYRAVIKSELKKGVLTYGDLVLPGKERKEILISTYVCHPSLANNELSGPVIATALAQWLSRMEDRRFTYRIYFGPETIGSIVYLSRHLDHLRTNLAAGYVVTCAGDTRCYSLLHSRYGDTLADRLTKHVMGRMVGEFIEYSFLDRGSDERQYCSPGVDLPVVSVMRSKYGAYPEYHTSLDDLDFISPSGLGGSLSVLKACLHCLEHNRTYRVVQPCEPQLGRRGLYPNLSAKSDYSRVRDMMNMLAYCDGRNDLAQIAEITGVDFLRLVRIAEKLWAAQVIEEVLAVDG